MSELQRNPSGKETHKQPPNYLLRRAGAAVVAGALVFGVAKGGERIVNDLREHDRSPIELGNEDNARYVVQGGDTPWTIARNHWGEEKDIRPLVGGITEQLGENGFLMPGQVIELPPFEHSEK